MHQFSLDEEDDSKKKLATRHLLVMAIVCFVFVVIFASTLAVVVIVNLNDNNREIDKDPSMVINASSFVSEVQESVFSSSVTLSTQSSPSSLCCGTSYFTEDSKFFSESLNSWPDKESSTFKNETSLEETTANTNSVSSEMKTHLPTTFVSITTHYTKRTNILTDVLLTTNYSADPTSIFLTISTEMLESSVSTTWISSPIFTLSSTQIFNSSTSSTPFPTKSSTFSPITLPSCSTTEFRCRSGQCVSAALRCDRFTQCQDMSDEEHCTNCIGVQCDSGLCLWSWQPSCNGIVECLDLSDEKNCASDRKRQCGNGVWINKYQWCDGIDNCLDNSDEKNCSCVAGLETLCGDGHCIRDEWVCDGYRDCSTDELNCITENCTAADYICSDYSCINSSWICDGKVDCHAAEDEQNCFQFSNSSNGLSGELFVKFKGENFYGVCSSGWNEKFSNSVCKNMGYGDASVMKEISGQTTQYVEINSSEPNEESILSAINVVLICTSNKTVHITCMPKVCGKQSGNIVNPYIVGGDIAVPGRWPWVVSISYLGKPICGGVLISQRWVLTAGHCMVVPFAYNYTNTPNFVQVLLGTTKRSDTLDKTALKLRAVKIITHPDMEWTSLGPIYWDAALIKLERDLSYTPYIKAVCTPSLVSYLPLDSTCYLAGWGRTGMNQEIAVDMLREAKLKVWKESICQQSTVFGEERVDTNFTLCAGYTTGSLSGCSGDSGSPLMCIDGHGYWNVQGIMSSGTAQCGVASTQALRFTRVLALQQWIAQIIADNG